MLLNNFGGVFPVTASVKYDAWGRVVQTGTSIADASDYINNSYDALGRRITQVIGAATTQSFYDGSHDIEERRADGTVVRQLVWSGAGPSHLVLRDSPLLTTGGPKRLYSLTDAAGSTTSIVGFTQSFSDVFSGQPAHWQVVERYLYSADGLPIAVEADWTAHQINVEDEGLRPYTGTLYSWDWLYHGERFHAMKGDTEHNLFQPFGLYEGMGSGQWYDPQHGQTLTPNLAFSFDHDSPYDSHAEAYTQSGWAAWTSGVASTVAVAAATTAVILAAPVLVPIATAAGIVYVAYQAYEGYQQYGGIGGAFAKASGISTIYENATNTDWGDHHALGLDDYQRGAGLSGGILQLGGLIIGGAAIASRAGPAIGGIAGRTNAWAAELLAGQTPSPLLAGIYGDMEAGALAGGGAPGLGGGMPSWLNNLTVLASTGNLSSLINSIQGKLNLYPKIIDPRTGRYIPFPSQVEGIVPQNQRATWGVNERAAFIAEWYERGYSTPSGGWEYYDIHHILPREYGGGNNFWNLVPVERQTHQALFNEYWRLFTES